eukprot:PhM_4_TR2860/c0_g1_i1/m.40734
MQNPAGEMGKRMTSRQAAARRRQNFRFVRPTIHPSMVPKSAEHRDLLHSARMNAALRQFRVRDDMCSTRMGTVVMSPSMQAAYMRVYRLYDKGEIRSTLSELVPILSYRLFDDKAGLGVTNDAEKMLPENQPDTLNAMKDKLYKSKEKIPEELKRDNRRLVDFHSQAKLRRDIKMKLFRFHRKIAQHNAMASRSVLYTDKDAAAYFLYRSPAMYAATYYVLRHLSTMMPHFVPRSVLDFGAGTGTALMAAKEVYNPAGLMHEPLKHHGRTFSLNLSSRQHSLNVLNDELKELDAETAERKRKRFLAVVGLVNNGEIDLEDIPSDLRHEIMRVGLDAVRNARERTAREKHARLRRIVVEGGEWNEEKERRVEELDKRLSESLGVMEANTAAEATPDSAPGANATSGADEATDKTWWEKVVDAQEAKERHTDGRTAMEKAMKTVVGVEPSQGMMEVAMSVLAEEVPNVHWRRYLSAEGANPDEINDLVIAAYTFSEIAGDANRKKTLADLWARTGKVLVIVETASRPNFDLLMQLRDTIIELKDATIWEDQPTIVAPCPHEQRCPLRHCGIGVRRREMRVCHSTVTYNLTFVERWLHKTRFSRGKENFSYLVIARNGHVPGRKERQQRIMEAVAAKAAEIRAQRQEELRREEEAVRAESMPMRVSEEEKTNPLDSQQPQLTASGASADAKKDLIPQAEWVKGVDGRWSRSPMPERLPVPQHKYNRLPSLDVSYRQSRLVNSNEMLTVRAELDEYREKFVPKLHQYARVVSEPIKRGHIWANMCTPEGELIKTKVYRRLRESAVPTEVWKKYKNSADANIKRWQFVGGWYLLRRSARGSLFPFDVPLYKVHKYRLVDEPNTLLDDKINTVEATAMRLGDHRDAPLEASTAGAPSQEEADRRKKEQEEAHRIAEVRRGVEGDTDPLNRFKEITRNMAGLPVDADLSKHEKKPGKQSLSYPWEDRKISTEEWAKVVQGSKRRMKEAMKERKLLRVQQGLRDKKKPSYVP